MLPRRHGARARQPVSVRHPSGSLGSRPNLHHLGSLPAQPRCRHATAPWRICSNLPSASLVWLPRACSRDHHQCSSQPIIIPKALPARLRGITRLTNQMFRHPSKSSQAGLLITSCPNYPYICTILTTRAWLFPCVEQPRGLGISPLKPRTHHLSRPTPKPPRASREWNADATHDGG